MTARDVLAYVRYLREERGNGDSAVNRAVVVLRRFYRAMVAMGRLDNRDNPLAQFPTIRAVARKLPLALSGEQVERVLAQPRPDTEIGLRDRTLLALLYGTGIRASECASLCRRKVDLKQLTIRVAGKGGHERVTPQLNRGRARSALHASSRRAWAPAAPIPESVLSSSGGIGTT